MTRKEFMRNLDKKIMNLDYEVKMNTFKFFEEYFDDLNLNLDDDIPSNMNFDKIVEDILKEENFKYEENEEKGDKEKNYFYFNLGDFISKNIVEIKYESIKSIYIKDAVTSIIIKKGEENKIVIPERLEKNICYKNNNLKIKDISINLGKSIEIYYNTDELDIELLDIVGNIVIDIPKKTNICLKDIVGRLRFYKELTLSKLELNGVIGKINKDDVKFDNNLDRNISISSVVGSINFN